MVKSHVPITNFGLKRPNTGAGSSQTKNKFARRIYWVPLCGTLRFIFNDMDGPVWAFILRTTFSRWLSFALRATFALRA